jgi:hypothetical protein
MQKSRRCERLALSAFIALGSAALVFSCGTQDPTGQRGGRDTPTGGAAGDPVPGGDLGGGSPGSGGGSIGGGLGLADAGHQLLDSSLLGDACASSTYEGESMPLDIFIMFDQSGSMNEKANSGTKWDAVKGALQTFVNDPASAGIGVGIQYFPLGIPTTPCTMNGPDCQCIDIFIAMLCSSTAQGSCTVDDYAKPDVPIGQLPAVAPAIVSSLNAHQPGGQTPTMPAVQGALNYATSWAQAHTDRKTVFVLATDGNPTGCDRNTNTPDNIASMVVAPAAAANPAVKTFVIGVGDSLTSLNAIAAAGGTNQALIIDTAGDPGKQFLDAMKQIRGVSLACDFVIPKPADGGGLDYSRVNVSFTSNGTQELVGYAASPSACDPTTGGWYYDNPANPTKLALCPATCNQATVSVSVAVDILLGCERVPVPTPR